MSSVCVRLFDDLSIRKRSASRHAPECLSEYSIPAALFEQKW